MKTQHNTYLNNSPDLKNNFSAAYLRRRDGVYFWCGNELKPNELPWGRLRLQHAANFVRKEVKQIVGIHRGKAESYRTPYASTEQRHDKQVNDRKCSHNIHTRTLQ